MAFDADPRWLGDAAWTSHAWPVDASSRTEPPYDLHAPPVDPAAFKDALAQLASGVAIVSCWDGSAPRGLLVSSITGLSVDPPRFLFCVRKQASSHDALLRARRCGVAVLAEDDEAEALRFSTPGLSQERFEPGRWDLTPDAAPAYQSGLSTTACVIDHRIETGTHTVFMVSAIAVRSTPGRPLIVHARTFQRLGLAASSPKGL